MAIAWIICPYKRRNPGQVPPVRYAAIDDFTALIRADGGDWDETEILGDHALVKVRADPATLATINAAAGFVRFPNHFDLDDTLGDLTVGQRNALKAKALELGYTQAEIDAALPANWGAVTLRQVLRFLAGRRLKPRYDSGTDSIVVDGPVQPVKPVDLVAARVV
jgi:hypothetical protein